MKGRFCAHRGVSALMPENSLPAFAAALALGADEIEFDVYLTKDKKMIVSHDPVLDRISDKKGEVSDFTLSELREANIGLHQGWNVSFCTPEEIFELFSGKMTFNIHIKTAGEDGSVIKELAELIRKYDAYETAYFAGSPNELAWMRKIAPEIQRTAIQLTCDPMPIYEMAKQYECNRVQFWLGMFDKELIRKLHDEGVRCNLFFADTPENYEKYFAMGIDTLLTNRMGLAAKYRKTKACVKAEK